VRQSSRSQIDLTAGAKRLLERPGAPSCGRRSMPVLRRWTPLQVALSPADTSAAVALDQMRLVNALALFADEASRQSVSGRP